VNLSSRCKACRNPEPNGKENSDDHCASLLQIRLRTFVRLIMPLSGLNIKKVVKDVRHYQYSHWLAARLRPAVLLQEFIDLLSTGEGPSDIDLVVVLVLREHLLGDEPRDSRVGVQPLGRPEMDISARY